MLLTSAFLLGVVAPSASALPDPFFGFQSSGGYENDATQMDIVAKSGAKYWRVSFPCFEWKEAKDKNPATMWDAWDKKVRLAWERGITVFATVGGRCNAVSFGFPAESEWKPGGSIWETFLYEVVLRYGKGGSFWAGKSNKKEIGSWEVWNEPNLGENGAGAKIANGYLYGQLFKRSSEAIHAAQGTFFSTTVLFGGMMYGPVDKTGESSGGFWNVIPHDFMQEASAVPGIAFWVNGVAIHPYEFGANAVPGTQADINEARADVNKYFGSDKSLWITEVGWPLEPWGTGTPFTPVSLASQADALRALFDWVKGQQAAKNIQSLIFYMYRDFDWNAWFGHAGLVGLRDGEQREFRPAWFEFQREVGAPYWGPQTVALQGSSGNMFSWRTLAGSTDRLLGMAPGTSPSVAALTGGGFWGEGYVVASQDNTGHLSAWTPTNGGGSLGLTMASGTNPSVAGMKFGNYVTAIQEKTTGNLYTWSTTEGAQNRLLGMAKGTSPSVAAKSNNNYVAAIQANTGNLFTWSTTESGINRGLGMAPGTSPSVAVLTNGEFVVAFQANTGNLWVWRSNGTSVNTLLGMAPGTSPSVAATPNGSYAAAIQANTGNLFTWTPNESGQNRLLGMAKGTSPSIAALSTSPVVAGEPNNPYAVAIQANTGQLFTWTTRESGQNQGVAMAAGTNPSIQAGATPFPAPGPE